VAASIECGATIKMGIRIASPELLPKTGPLPHLICSRQSNLGSGDEEGEHGDTSGIDFGDQGALRLGRAAGKGKDSGHRFLQRGSFNERFWSAR
jgi:hypothetical protein